MFLPNAPGGVRVRRRVRRRRGRHRIRVLVPGQLKRY